MTTGAHSNKQEGAFITLLPQALTRGGGALPLLGAPLCLAGCSVLGLAGHGHRGMAVARGRHQKLPSLFSQSRTEPQEANKTPIVSSKCTLLVTHSNGGRPCAQLQHLSSSVGHPLHQLPVSQCGTPQKGGTKDLALTPGLLMIGQSPMGYEENLNCTR